MKNNQIVVVRTEQTQYFNNIMQPSGMLNERGKKINENQAKMNV